MSSKLQTLPSENVLLFAGGSQQGQCLLITDRVVNNIKILQCDDTSVSGPRYSHPPAAEETFLPRRPDVHNSIVSPPYCRPDDTVTSIITAVWSIIGATFLQPSFLAPDPDEKRNQRKLSFVHLLWDPASRPFFTVELWQRRPATTESPRTAAGRPCTPLFACTGSNTTPLL